MMLFMYMCGFICCVKGCIYIKGWIIYHFVLSMQINKDITFNLVSKDTTR